MVAPSVSHGSLPASQVVNPSQTPVSPSGATQGAPAGRVEILSQIGPPLAQLVLPSTQPPLCVQEDP